MPTGLKTLQLPILVEARRSAEEVTKTRDAENVPDLSASFRTSHSTLSDLPSPVTPTFAPPGHGRFGSSTSSVDEIFQGYLRSNTSPPSTIDLSDSFPSSGRFLPGVKEEPSERDDDYDMLDDTKDQYDCYGDLTSDDNRLSMFMSSSNGYDLADGFVGDGDFLSHQSYKKRRASDSPLSGITTRIGTRFPSFSRRWKGRKVSGASSVDNGSQRSSTMVSSSRTSSLTCSTLDANDYQTVHGTPYPSSPTSLLEGVDRFDDDDSGPTSLDIDRANSSEDRGDRTQATTPLLPPLLVPETVTASKEEPIQSPLQSPTIAGPCETFSVINSPVNKAGTVPVVSGMPSPPLSTRNSISSLHRPAASHLVPADDIPMMKLADPEDEWAQKLGHANFDIHPEPYRPDTFDTEACRQFHANWALARCNFTKQIVRTGEHFGPTSKMYKLTEEKWTEIDAQWRAHNEVLVENNAALTGENTVALRETTAGPATVVEIPSLSDPRSEGKFPKLGDEVIVGPMVQIASQMQRKPSRRRALMKFINHVKMPVLGLGLGRLGRRRSRTF